MKLSKRLTALAALVYEGYVLADVGTDHGYIPIYLIEQKRIPHAIALDINRGPILRAEEHIALYGMEDYIQTRLSDGVEALAPGEAESILIAGMGGGLIIHILNEGMEVCKCAKELILQPQSELVHVREYLRKHGFVVEAEDMIEEDGKYYPMMRVQMTETSNQDDSTKTQLFDTYGKILLENRHPVLFEYLRKEEGLYTGIRDNLWKQKKNDNINKRIADVNAVLRLNESAMAYFR